MTKKTHPDRNWQKKRLTSVFAQVFIALAIAVVTSCAANRFVSRNPRILNLVSPLVYLNEAMGLESTGNLQLEVSESQLQDNPQIRRFATAIRHRLDESTRSAGRKLEVSIRVNPVTFECGWPFVSERPHYVVDVLSYSVMGGKPRQFEIYADLNGEDPFSFLGFLGNTAVYFAIVLFIIRQLARWRRA